MANLIITENSLMAIYVAAALEGIKQGKNMISLDDIPRNTETLNKMVLDGAKSFETVIEGTQTHVTWLGDDPLQEEEIKNPPEVFRYKSYKLSEESLSRLTRNKYKDQKKEKIDAVYFALIETEKNAILKEVVKKTLPAKSFYNMHIREISKNGIRKAYASAENYNSAQSTRAKLLDAHRTNIKKELKSRIGEDLNLDHYALCFMMLITRRETIRKSEKVKYQIQARSHIHGIPCAFVGRGLHTKEEAENIIKEFPQTVIFDGRYDEGLLKTLDIFSAKDIWEENSLSSLLKDMFIKGYISNPITNDTLLPMSFRSDDDEKLISACRDWTGEETMEKREVKRTLEKLKTKKQILGAITPCGTKGKEHMPLSDTEKTIYDTIICKTRDKIHSNAKDTFRFFAGDYPLFTKFYVDEIKNHLRSEEHLAAVFEATELKNSRKFGLICVYEVFAELDNRNIGNADIYIQTLKTLKESSLIKINNNGGITLSEKGEDVFSKVPAGKTFLDLCSKWEKELDDFPDTRWSKESLNEFKEKLDSDKALWDKAKGVKTDYQLCPACKKKTLIESAGSFTCNSCGFSIKKDYENDGYRCLVTKDDLIRLAQKGKSLGKTFRKENKSISAFIILKNKTLDITNETDLKCPSCGKVLFAYDWGFGCEDCDFSVPFEVNGIKLPMTEFLKLIKGQKTDLIKGFKDKDGNIFDASLSIKKKDGRNILIFEKVQPTNQT